MTDNNVWQPPSGAPIPAQAPFTPVNPQFSPPAPGGQQLPAWTPPPKPGLIPLRPLGFGTLLGASFQVIRRNPRPTFGFALLLNGLVLLIFAGVIGGVLVWAFGRVNFATGENADEITAGAVGALVLAALIPVALSVLVGAILQGVISLEVSRGTIGEKLTVRALWRLARGRIGALIGWSAITTAAILVAVVVVTLLIVLVVTVGGDNGVIAAVVVGIGAFLVGIVLTFWISTKLALVPSVLMLERVPLLTAIGRSWRLTSGYAYFWKTLGTLLLVNLIVQTASQIVSVPLSLLLGIGTALINPNGDGSAAIALIAVTYGLSGILSLVFAALASVTQSSAAALIYIDIRMRKEGLDLELTRFVEARQVGDLGVGNPYLPEGATSGYAAPSGSAATQAGPPQYGPPSVPGSSPWA